jgi:probable F420-dependent oxidoreductase
MRVGIQAFSTDQGIGPVELATEMEARGFGSLFLTEHTHIPSARNTPMPGGGTLPEYYSRTWDPYVALGAVAARTSTMLLGTGISLLLMRDPLITAKEVATLDHLSNGRFALGVGFGWNRDEALDHPPADEQWSRRYDVVREKVALMRAVWRDDVASYSGRHVSLQPSWVWPKPAPGRPRVFVGGVGPKAMRQAAQWGDVWYALPDGEGNRTRFAEFRQMVEDAGRDPSTVGISVAAATPDPALFEIYRSEGAELVNMHVEPRPRDEMLALLDEWQPLVDQFG